MVNQKSPGSKFVRWLSLFISSLAILGVGVLVGRDLWSNYQQRLIIEERKKVEPPSSLGPSRPPTQTNYKPTYVLAEQPPISNPKTVTAQAAGSRIHDDDLVLGVVIGGIPRAYPINMMTGPLREIFNDELAGRSIAATW